MLSKRSAVETSRGSAVWLKHNLTLAVENLNNSKNSVAGKKKEFVSTRFLDYAWNDTKVVGVERGAL